MCDKIKHYYYNTCRKEKHVHFSFHCKKKMAYLRTNYEEWQQFWVSMVEYIMKKNIIFQEKEKHFLMNAYF